MTDQTPSNHHPLSTQSARGQPLLVCLLLLLLCLPCESPAPIYGFFPGLSQLLERADVVVVADIPEKAGTIGFGAGGVFKIRIRKVLKGEAEEGRAYSAYLRDLGFHLTQTNYCPSLFPEGMKPGARGVFFLNKSNRAEPKVDFWNENCEGDAFAVNPKADLKTLSGLKPREAIELLLRDSSAYYGERFPSYRSAVTNMLASP